MAEPPRTLKQIEQAILGAMLLRHDRTDELLAILDGATLRHWRHGRLHAAIAAVRADGATADPVTVAERFSRGADIEHIVGYVHELVAAAPAGDTAVALARRIAPQPGAHRFRLLADGDDRPEARAALAESPPAGCVADDFDGGSFGLDCQRHAPSYLEAVAAVVAETRDRHGIVLNDLGVEKLWEFSHDGRDGHGAQVLGQLLLMSAERAADLGYSRAEAVAFLDAVWPDTPEATS